MKVILPVAGYATRLYPLTENQPKALLKLGPKLMVEHILDKLRSIEEIDEIFLVTNEKYFQNFVDWAKNYNSPKIKVLNDGTRSNDDRLGAVGDVQFAIEKGNIDDDLFVIAGDNLCGLDLKKLVNFSDEKNSSVFAAKDIPDKSILCKMGIVEIDDDQKVLGFEEKPEHPKSSLAATMIYLIKRSDLHFVNECLSECNPDNWGTFASYLASKTALYCLSFDEYWFDIGNLDQYNEVNELFNRGEL